MSRWTRPIGVNVGELAGIIVFAVVLGAGARGAVDAVLDVAFGAVGL